MPDPHHPTPGLLRPQDTLAALHVLIGLALLSGGLAAAASGSTLLYVVGQVLLALGFTQALVLAHEAGHRTLFRSRGLNDAVGTVATFVALLPYPCWRPIHARHHRYTGWQDLDATTESLVPRTLSRFERTAVNLAWRGWIPLFSILYRVRNYWQLGRIQPFLPTHLNTRRLRWAIRLQLLAYAALIAWTGVLETLMLIGPALYLALAFQDILLLSQHTHMPSHLSQGEAVTPFPPRAQGPFTRSLALPSGLSWLLLHFDAHERHHLYPAVPGYLLKKLPDHSPNTVHWLTWLREVKRLSGEKFLFGGPHPEIRR